jgi:hypothetical protein
MKNIVQASEIYKMENDSYPPDCWETIKEEDILEIKKTKTTPQLIRGPNKNYHQILRDKLHWGSLNDEAIA